MRNLFIVVLSICSVCFANEQHLANPLNMHGNQIREVPSITKPSGAIWNWWEGWQVSNFWDNPIRPYITNIVNVTSNALINYINDATNKLYILQVIPHVSNVVNVTSNALINYVNFVSNFYINKKSNIEHMNGSLIVSQMVHAVNKIRIDHTFGTPPNAIDMFVEAFASSDRRLVVSGALHGAYIPIAVGNPIRQQDAVTKQYVDNNFVTKTNAILYNKLEINGNNTQTTELNIDYRDDEIGVISFEEEDRQRSKILSSYVDLYILGSVVSNDSRAGTIYIKAGDNYRSYGGKAGDVVIMAGDSDNLLFMPNDSAGNILLQSGYSKSQNYFSQIGYESGDITLKTKDIGIAEQANSKIGDIYLLTGSGYYSNQMISAGNIYIIPGRVTNIFTSTEGSYSGKTIIRYLDNPNYPDQPISRQYFENKVFGFSGIRTNVIQTFFSQQGTAYYISNRLEITGWQNGVCTSIVPRYVDVFVGSFINAN